MTDILQVLIGERLTKRRALLTTIDTHGEDDFILTNSPSSIRELLMCCCSPPLLSLVVENVNIPLYLFHFFAYPTSERIINDTD
jgi:hypothetical protein